MRNAHRLNRRHLLSFPVAVAPGLILANGSSGLLARQAATPIADPAGTPVPDTVVSAPAATGPGHLVIADNTAATIHIVTLPSLELVTSLPDITMNDHAGFLPLPGGRVLFVDTTSDELVTLQLDDATEAEITSRISVPSVVSHFAVDATGCYVVVGASDEDRPLTLVDLERESTTSFAVPVGEAGVALGGDPLMLLHRNDTTARVEAYLVEDVLAGNATLVDDVATGQLGHGEAISHTLAKFCTATDDGLDVLSIADGGLTYDQTLPWDADGREGGRGYFVRLAPDGRTVVSYMADRPPDEPWAAWSNDAYIADLETGDATRVPLAPGLVYRFGMGAGRATFYNVHPDGDHAIVIDVDPTSATVGETLAMIPLVPMTDGPTAETEPWYAEFRVAMMTPDGTLGFVTHGGDGIISLIDIAAGTLLGQLSTPTPLSGGGYLIAVQPEMSFADTIAR